MCASSRLDLVEAGPADRHDPVAETAGDGGQLGQRLQILLHDFGTSRQLVGRRGLPPRLFEEVAGGLIDVVLQGGEDPDMTPVPDMGGDIVGGFQDQRFKPVGQQVGCRGQPDRASADDGDGKGVHGWLHSFR